MGLRHQIPSEFTDEDRWFKFFTKTTLKYLIAGLVITYLLFKLFGLIGFSYWCDNRVSYNHWIGFYCILSDSGDTVYQRGKPYDCQNP